MVEEVTTQHLDICFCGTVRLGGGGGGEGVLSYKIDGGASRTF